MTVQEHRVTFRGSRVGFSDKEVQAMDILLQPGVRTYADGARRLGITENAFKQRMSRAQMRYHIAKSLCNQWEGFRRSRREARRKR